MASSKNCSRKRHASQSEIKPASHNGHQHAARSRSRATLQAGGVLLSLAGVLACNYFGLGLGRVVCHGLLVASLGSPIRRTDSKSVRAY